MASKIFHRMLIPAAALMSDVSEDESCPCHEPSPPNPNACKPSQLPIYVPEPIQNEIAPDQLRFEQLEDAIFTARKAVKDFFKEVEAYEKVGENYINEGIDKADWLIQYLREEENTLPKAGAIAIGGLAGLILGLRGRFFKRTLYMTTGALGMAAVCYPKQAAEYSHLGVNMGRKYATIGYNFVYGVKKGDPPMELPQLPQLPSSFSEFTDNVTKSVKSIFSGLKGSTEECDEPDATQVGEEPIESCTIKARDPAFSRDECDDEADE